MLGPFLVGQLGLLSQGFLLFQCSSETCQMPSMLINSIAAFVAGSGAQLVEYVHEGSLPATISVIPVLFIFAPGSGAVLSLMGQLHRDAGDMASGSSLLWESLALQGVTYMVGFYLAEEVWRPAMRAQYSTRVHVCGSGLSLRADHLEKATPRHLNVHRPTADGLYGRIYQTTPSKKKRRASRLRTHLCDNAQLAQLSGSGSVNGSGSLASAPSEFGGSARAAISRGGSFSQIGRSVTLPHANVDRPPILLGARLDFGQRLSPLCPSPPPPDAEPEWQGSRPPGAAACSSAGEARSSDGAVTVPIRVATANVSLSVLPDAASR
eukprot:7344652-Prymnesium_polylepis.1